MVDVYWSPTYNMYTMYIIGYNLEVTNSTQNSKDTFARIFCYKIIDVYEYDVAVVV